MSRRVLGIATSLVSRAAIRLALVSFLSLYLELTFIRWAPLQVRLLAYFSNYVLIAALLGLGLGMMLASSPRRLLAYFPVALLAVVVGLLALERANFVIPLVADGQFIWNYLADIQPSGFLAYGILLAFFLAVVTLFAFIGQEVGLALQPFPSLTGYSLNIFGSLLGVVGFALMSFLESPPTLWFAAGAAVYIAYLIIARWRHMGVLVAAAALAGTVVIVGADAGTAGAARYWSPYYEIEATPIIHNGARVGTNVAVNKDSHQQALDLSDGRSTLDPFIGGRARLYDLPYEFGVPETVLVVGAGTGNDVAAAIRNAPDATIDAVEIDPVIARLGTTVHPEHPYRSPKVNVAIDDARSFLQKSSEPYDLIVFGFLDSHRLFSHMSSVRMDNYVYTVENFNRVRDRLSADGVVAVTFTVHEKWIADRINTVMTRVFGHEPLVYQGDSNGWGTTFLAARHPLSVPPGATVLDEDTAARELFTDSSRISWRYSKTEGFLPSGLLSTSGQLLTDDWPFLYMQSRSIPPNYLFALLLTVAASLAFVWRTVPAIDARNASNWNFLALGAAFALLETRGITEVALVFGSTWLTNTIVIGAVLVMILCANLAVRLWTPPLGWVYGGLIAVILIDYFFPLQGILGLDFSIQVLAAGVRVAAPMFFSGIIFARWFATTRTPAAALGANLIGAVIGGLLEYLSLVVGLRQLYLLAVLFYAASAGLALTGEVGVRRSPSISEA